MRLAVAAVLISLTAACAYATRGNRSRTTRRAITAPPRAPPTRAWCSTRTTRRCGRCACAPRSRSATLTRVSARPTPATARGLTARTTRAVRDLAVATLAQALTRRRSGSRSPRSRRSGRRVEPLADKVAHKLGADDDRVDRRRRGRHPARRHPTPPGNRRPMLHSEDPRPGGSPSRARPQEIGKPALDYLESRPAAIPTAGARGRAALARPAARPANAAAARTERISDPDGRSARRRQALAHIGASGPTCAAQLVELARTALDDHALGGPARGGAAARRRARGPASSRSSRRSRSEVALQAAIAARRGSPPAAAPERAAPRRLDDARGRRQLPPEAVGRAAALPRDKLAADPELAVRLAAARVLAHAGLIPRRLRWCSNT